MSSSGGGGSNDWCTIESDPGVFTEMLEDMGCKHIELEELWSLDDEALGQLTANGGIVYGLIFLFKWIGNNNNKQQQEDPSENKNNTRIPLKESECPSDLFFAHQVTTNACATQAILSVLMNAKSLGEEQLGTTLFQFQNFTESFPPSLKGEAISSSEEIRKVHNSFARADAFLQDGKIHFDRNDEEKEDVYHFIAFIPNKQQKVVYELDGLQEGPIQVGTYDDDDSDSESNQMKWLSVAREAIQKRMDTYTKAGSNANHEIKFNLMAVIQDHRYTLQKYIEALQAQEQDVTAAIQELSTQESKRQRWKLENQRRRHNYLPLCIEVLKSLARVGKLEELTQDAKQRYIQKINSRKAFKQAQK